MKRFIKNGVRKSCQKMPKIEFNLRNLLLIADCPQVQCVDKFVATQPDELSLEETDVVNVNRKMGDGKYQ